MTDNEKSQWQPIETAPKDGTRVLVWRKGVEVGTARFRGVRGQFSNRPPCWYREQSSEPVDATHWMPLPEPPA